MKEGARERRVVPPVVEPVVPRQGAGDDRRERDDEQRREDHALVQQREDRGVARKSADVAVPSLAGQAAVVRHRHRGRLQREGDGAAGEVLRHHFVSHQAGRDIDDFVFCVEVPVEIS